MLPEITSSISIVASVLSMASSIKNIMKRQGTDVDAAIKIYKTSVPQSEATLIDDPLFKASVTEIMVISDELLSQLADEAKKCQRQHTQARQVATRRMDIDKADVQAGECVCGVLRDIMRYNKGILPTGAPELQKAWESFSCKE